MFMTRVYSAHAMPFGQHGRPMHVAVTEQSEMRIDTFCRKGISEHVVKAVVGHVAFRPGQTHGRQSLLATPTGCA
jgi:hypothetical protein